MVAKAKVMPAGGDGLHAGIALASRREGLADISLRADADAPLEPDGELPFEDRAVRSLWLGDAVAALSVRDQVQLLAEIRRVLMPGARVLLDEPRAAATHALLARWASLVGLAELPVESAAVGWMKRDTSAGSEPLVSILIPSSNPRYFLECLDSAIAQTYPNIEIIICDDSEGEAIPAMVASRAAQAAIQYVKNPERLRARGNCEKCLSLARGEFVKFLNDDDVLEPDCVRTLLGAFLQVPDLTLATSHRWRIDAASRVVEDMPATRPVVDRDLVIGGLSLANAVIMYGLNFIGEPTTAMFRRRDLDRKSAHEDARPFQFNGAEVRGAFDFAIWSRLLIQGNAAFFRARLSRFRAHDEQGQARPEVVAQSIAGIRGLQRQWIELGLFRRFPPHLLLCQPLPRDEADANKWYLAPVLSRTPSQCSPPDALRAWRATKHHALDHP
jgi:glycosyltransferase involved in cell wall biosynthesis